MTESDRSEQLGKEAVNRAREALRGAREALASAERALGEVRAQGSERSPKKARETVELTWKERLWTAPAECRIGIQELTEAIGVSKSWAYNRTKKKADPCLPHAKIGGALVFKCGEVRAWIRDHEEVEVAYRMDSAPGELRVERRVS